MLLQEAIRTERLILRPFALTDAPRVKALAGDQRINETTLCIPYPYEEGMAESWISTHQRCFYEGHGVVFAICLSNGLLIGAATRAAVAHWGLEVLCLEPAEYSPVLTAVLMPPGHDADQFRKTVLDAYNMSLGSGLANLPAKCSASATSASATNSP